MVNTLNAVKIVPLHLKLHWKKTMISTSKKNSQALGIWMFKQARRSLLQRGRGKKQFPRRSWSFQETWPWSIMKPRPRRGISMACLKESKINVLVDALTCHQKVVDHLHLGPIYLLEIQGDIKFQFAKRSLTTIILVRFVFSSFKKTIGIPWEGDASFMVFFGFLLNEK